MTVELPKHLEGLDEYRAATNAVVVAAIFLCVEFVLWCAGEGLLALIATAISVIPILVAWYGTRYRCTVDHRWVTLTRYTLFLPLRRKRLLLDVEPRIYWCWEDGDLGVSLAPADSFEETDPFGPWFSEDSQAVLVRELKRSLSRARATVRPRSKKLCCPALMGQEQSLEIQEWNSTGVNQVAYSTAVVRIGEMSFPAGSKFYFNTSSQEQDFRDPRRDDELCSVVCGDGMDLPNGLTVQSGARIQFFRKSDRFMVVDGFDQALLLDGVSVDGTAPIVFDHCGRATSYRLASPLVIGEFCVPTGSEISSYHIPVYGTGLHVRLSEDAEYDGKTYEAEDFLSFRSPVAVMGLSTQHLDAFVLDKCY